MKVQETLSKCLFMLENMTNMIQLQQIQSLLMKTSLDQHPLALNKLFSFCATSDKGDCNYASSILTHARNPTNFMYNMVIRGFSQSQQPQAALLWFPQMASRGQILPDNFTFTFLLKACARLFDPGVRCFNLCKCGGALYRQMGSWYCQ